jgi:hypothetical protein
METILLVVALVAAIALAWVLTSKFREHRPIAVLLSILLGIAVAKYALDVTVLAPLRATLGLAPWTGWAWAAALLSHSIGLVWSAAIAGTALVLFMGKKPWLAAVGWAAAVIAYAAIHPLAPTGGQARFHIIVNVAGVVSAAVIAMAWYRGKPSERASSAQLTLTAIIMADLLTVPGALHVGAFKDWPTPQTVYLATFALLGVVQGYAVMSRLVACERRQDAADKAVFRSNLFAEGAMKTARRAEEKAIEARDLADLAVPSSKAP